MNSVGIVDEIVVFDLQNKIKNMKICLKDLRDTYDNDGEHPHRARYLCYAMDYIVDSISVDKRGLDVVRKEFADYADICWLSVINGNHHWNYNCEANCEDNAIE